MAPPQWAYQVEHYVKEPDEELVCSICRAVFCDPTLCPCDHVFCKACITKWLENNRNCPICRKRASMTSIKQTVPIVKNLIMKLMVNCHNKSLGCKGQFSVEGSEAHAKECEYEFVQCSNKPCTDKLFRKDIVEHETKDCPHRPIRCKKCKSKLPTSSMTDEHEDCIRALRDLVKERTKMVRRKLDRIKQLKAEIKTLKARLKDSGRSRMSSFSRSQSLNSDTVSSISPDEITINIQEYDDSVSSISSDSDMSSDSFYIFTNEGLHDNEESDSFSAYMDNEDNVENENTRDASEYRNAESQTVPVDPISIIGYRRDYCHRSSNLAYENDSTIVEVPNSVFGETEERSQPQRPVKRRPTTQKPAKRRHRPVTLSSDDDDNDNDDDGHAQLASRTSKHNWRVMTAGTDEATEAAQGDAFNSHLEAGPSSASAPVRSSKPTVSDHSKSKNRSRSKSKQKRARQAEDYARDNTVSSRVGVTSDNPVFERTLALLEHYSLDSDPEWLPQYASHRGNDTTTESDSSFFESSNSDLSDAESLEHNSVSPDDSQHERPAISEFMNWMFDSTSEDDPDWRPPDYAD